MQLVTIWLYVSYELNCLLFYLFTCRFTVDMVIPDPVLD